PAAPVPGQLLSADGLLGDHRRGGLRLRAPADAGAWRRVDPDVPVPVSRGRAKGAALLLRQARSDAGAGRRTPAGGLTRPQAILPACPATTLDGRMPAASPEETTNAPDSASACLLRPASATERARP